VGSAWLKKGGENGIKDTLDPELLEDVLVMERGIKERLDNGFKRFPNVAQNLFADGHIVHVTIAVSGISVASLNLAQIATTIHKDLDMARHHLAVPLGEAAKPGFGDLCCYIGEGMRGAAALGQGKDQNDWRIGTAGLFYSDWSFFGNCMGVRIF
jgi:hypothetical protein